jgi:ceramide glucosyltransferase
MLISTLLSILLFGLCLAALRFYGQVAFAAFETLHDTHQPEVFPSVTLLKAVCEAEPGSYANLVSFCQQDYPDYCLWLVVSDYSRPSVELVQRLIQQFPQCHIQLVSQSELGSIVSSLHSSRRAAQSKIWLLAEGNIRVKPDYLRRMIQPFQAASVGVVGCHTRSLQSWTSPITNLMAIEQYAKALVSRCCDQLDGPSLAIRAELLAKANAETVSSLSQLMAAVRSKDQWVDLGYRMVLASCAAEQRTAQAAYWLEWKQQIRWARQRRQACPRRYLQQGLSYGSLYGLLLLVTLGWGWAGVILGSIWMAEFTVIGLVGWICLKEPSIWRLGWLLPISNLVSFSLWICGLWGRAAELQPESQLKSTAASYSSATAQFSIR